MHKICGDALSVWFNNYFLFGVLMLQRDKDSVSRSLDLDRYMSMVMSEANIDTQELSAVEDNLREILSIMVGGGLVEESGGGLKPTDRFIEMIAMCRLIDVIIDVLESNSDGGYISMNKNAIVDANTSFDALRYEVAYLTVFMSRISILVRGVLGRDPLKVIPDFWIEMDGDGKIRSITYIDTESGNKATMDTAFTQAVDLFSSHIARSVVDDGKLYAEYREAVESGLEQLENQGSDELKLVLFNIGAKVVATMLESAGYRIAGSYG